MWATTARTLKLRTHARTHSDTHTHTHTHSQNHDDCTCQDTHYHHHHHHHDHCVYQHNRHLLLLLLLLLLLVVLVPQESFQLTEKPASSLLLLRLVLLGARGLVVSRRALYVRTTCVRKACVQVMETFARSATATRRCHKKIDGK